jgi:hypothetical protein
MRSPILFLRQTDELADEVYGTEEPMKEFYQADKQAKEQAYKQTKGE